MTKTRALQVRLTKEQHLQLQQLAGQRGFSSLAAYVRHCGLHHDFQLLDSVTALQRRVGSLDEQLRALHPDLVPDRAATARRDAAVPLRRRRERQEEPNP